jgi:hypothetical protein
VSRQLFGDVLRREIGGKQQGGHVHVAVGDNARDYGACLLTWEKVRLTWLTTVGHQTRASACVELTDGGLISVVPAPALVHPVVLAAALAALEACFPYAAHRVDPVNAH